MKFVWDSNKEKLNVRNHGISFTNASYVFNDPNALYISDVEHSDLESREIAIGMIPNSSIIFVVFTEKHFDEIRIISAREAEKEEKEYYYQRRGSA